MLNLMIYCLQIILQTHYTMQSTITEVLNINELLNQPLSDLQAQLRSMKMELKSTKFDDIYIIKFSPELKYSPIYAHLKGLIFHYPTKTVLSLTYPIPCNVTPKDGIPNALQKDFPEGRLVFQPILEGTLIRLSYFKTLGPPSIEDPSRNWVFSTNSCVDASEAFWLDKKKTFDFLFKDALEKCDITLDYSILDPRYVYLFWLQHPDNQIVCPISEPRVYLVGIISHVTYREDFKRYGQPVKGIQGISWYPRLTDEKVPSIEQAWDSVNKELTGEDITGPLDSVGYLLIDTETGQRYRFESSVYRYARWLRGSCNWVTVTIIDHLKNKLPEHMEDFLTFFPQFKETVKSVEQRIEEFVDDLFVFYKKKYIYKNKYFYPPKHTQITLKKLQKHWFENLKPSRQRMSKETIHQQLMALEPRQINRLLEQHQTYKKNFKETKKK